MKKGCKKVLIRVMTIDDYNEVYSLWDEAEEVCITLHDDTYEKLDLFLSRNPELCFVAIQNGNIVGAIIAGFDGRRGHIYHTVVKNGLRNQGIGKQLVQQVIHEYECLDVNEIDLITLSDNKIGNEFWGKCGFSLNHELNYRRMNLNNK